MSKIRAGLAILAVAGLATGGASADCRKYVSYVYTEVVTEVVDMAAPIWVTGEPDRPFWDRQRRNGS